MRVFLFDSTNQRVMEESNVQSIVHYHGCYVLNKVKEAGQVFDDKDFSVLSIYSQGACEKREFSPNKNEDCANEEWSI